MELFVAFGNKKSGVHPLPAPQQDANFWVGANCCGLIKTLFYIAVGKWLELCGIGFLNTAVSIPPGLEVEVNTRV